MKKDGKYERMKKRATRYGLIGVGCNVIGYIADKNDMVALSDVTTITGAAASAASIINFIRSLEYYEMDDADRFYIDHLWNMIVMPVVGSLSLGYSLAPMEKKRQIINRLKTLSQLG